jgi:hypothetical protein
MSNKELLIHVTAVDIDSSDPIRVAIERAIEADGGEMYHADIRGDIVFAHWGPGRFGDFRAKLPQEALDFLEAWNAGYHVSPIDFVLVPDGGRG